MKKLIVFVFVFIFSINAVFAQTPRAQAQAQSIDLTQYGIRIQPDARLIVMMLALEAAGFDPKEKSLFREQASKDLENLDADLRRRMRESFERSNKFLENIRREELKRAFPQLSAPELDERAKPSPSEQIARYVSLAYALGPAPDFTAPERTTDLPGSLLEVLDFAPLVQEFYRKARLGEKLPEYTQKFQAYGDEALRPATGKVVRDLTLYLSTRPQTVYLERVKVKVPASEKNKKQSLQKVETREHERRFFVVPDLLAVPNTVKLRVIGDDYYAVVGYFPPDSAFKVEESSELRRAYLQFLFDALVFKSGKEISAQREAIRSLLNEQAKAGASVSPDVFLAVARSMVVAADVQQRKQQRIEAATREARQIIEKNKPAANAPVTPAQNKIVQITPEVSIENGRLIFPKAEAEAFAELAEAVESGAVLAFYFADRLRGQESSGFDIANSFGEMIASFDAAKEIERLKQNAPQRSAAVAELNERRRKGVEIPVETAVKPVSTALVEKLKEVEQLISVKEYEQAENRLRQLLVENPGEPRVFYNLGRVASLWARESFDQDLITERLKKAETHYRSVVATGNAEPALLSLTHVALGKIMEYFENNDEALKQFNAAIAIGNVSGGAYNEALARKQRLAANK